MLEQAFGHGLVTRALLLRQSVHVASEDALRLREIRQLFDGFAGDTPAGLRWQKLATAKLTEMEALAARVDAMKQLLREALRCGCVELDACGKLFRSRNGSR